MDTKQAPEPEKQASAAPAPEVLAPRTEESLGGSPAAPAIKKEKKPKRGNYRPGHKGAFIGIAVVILVLAVNAGIIGFVLKSQGKTKNLGSEGQVTVNQAALDKLGVNRSAVGDAGIQLTVGPNSRFKGDVTVGGDFSVAGQLKVNNKFTAPDASFVQLEAGKTALSELNVNGDTNLSKLNLRNDLAVTGATKLQGPVTISQLLTVASSLAVGGSLSTNNLSVRSLNIDSTLSIGGHIITRGQTPGVGPGGPALGSNGTVGISGNDAAGTVSINIGVGAGTGSLANVAFKSQYGATPRVVITPVGVGGLFYVTRTASGFTIFTNTALPPGGYAVDYIVEQ
jgi:hypothetical protein